LKHINIALFVPHEGCPQQCVFCNQRSISGKSGKLTPTDIERAVNAAGIPAGNQEGKREIAFFGGSFTAIDREYMLELLDAASKYIDGNRFTGIRISTRPDAVDEEMCRLLKTYGVTAIELGAQSMDDRVLALNQRGHTAQSVVNASRLIASSGFELGLQMMTGLYGSCERESIETAEKIIELKPKTVRIYPTVVLKGTPLAALTAKGDYHPQTLDEATVLCSTLLDMFFAAGIEVIRLGLHAGGGIEEGYAAGPYHPAFRELCEGEIYFRKARQALLELMPGGGRAVACVSNSAVSQMTGHKRANIAALKMEGFHCQVKACRHMGKYEVSVSRAEQPGF
jgi:histone acetyltransferase (RNA polymerase elongator complex component)